MPTKGIDVSYANGSIDWTKAKTAIDFAIIRSSFGSDLPSQTDSFFHQNASGCQKNNIPFGIYHFAYFINEETAKQEADFAVRLAKEYTGVRFIALDVEEDSERYANRLGQYPNWTACCVAFMERVKAAGYKPVFYSNQSWLTTKLNYDTIRRYPLWYAAPYASSPMYNCAIWQYSWKGGVPGIIGDVDMNKCYDTALFADAPSTSTSSSVKSVPSSNAAIDQLSSSVAVDRTVRVMARDGINIRRGAGVTYDILGAVPYDTKLHIERQTADKTYTWGLTSYNSVRGWIALNYTKEETTTGLKSGDKVKVRSNATVYGTTRQLSNWVYDTIFTVIEVTGERAVIGLNGAVTAAVHKKDLMLAQ